MSKALLHLVFGGRVADTSGTEFVDTDHIHVVGIFPNYEAALKAWRAASQKRVDEADWKYVILHIHRMLEPNRLQHMLEPDRHDKKVPAKGKKNKKKKK